MSLIDVIKADQLVARKTKQQTAASILTTLIGEAEMVGKNAGRQSSDDEVQAVVKKFIKNNDEVLKVIGTSNQPKVDEIVAENTILRNYLPTALTEHQLTAMIVELIAGAAKPTNVGVIMKGLKLALHGNSDYDGALASKIAKSYIV